MTWLTWCGWAVAHSLWQCTLVAGMTALALGVLRNARAEARDRAARIGLAVMAIAPIATALSRADLLFPAVRRPILMTIDLAVPMPSYLAWRSAALPIVGAAWLLWVAVFLVRIVSAWRTAEALRVTDVSALAAETRASVDELRDALAITTPVDARRSTRAHVPMVLGWRRPVILLPDSALSALSADELRAILAHELAHVRRSDYVVNVLQLIAESAVSFHPAARWVAREIRVEREYCCDDAAIAVSDSRAVYARALAGLDDARSDCRLAVAAASGTLVDRIARIAGRPRRRLNTARGAVLMAASVAIAAALVALTFTLPPAIPAGTQVRSQRPPAGAPVERPGNALLMRKQRQPR
jgi:beta-lactamase regulating signal transducer with metallopeptidase domain